MERPVSIVWFERCYLGALVVGLVNFALQWPTMMAQLADNPQVAQLGSTFAPTVAIVSVAISTAISLLLWFLAARKRAVVAKWIITVFFVIGVLFTVFNAIGHKLPAGIGGVLAIVALVLNGVAVWQLFRPDAEAWFARGSTPNDGAARL